MKYTQLGIFAIVIMALWLLADYPLVGQVLVVTYVVVFWRRISSRKILQIVLVALAVIFLAVTIRNYKATTAFAIYTYALLIAAALALVKELWRYRRLQSQQKEDNA
jgi:hypothetical protein